MKKIILTLLAAIAALSVDAQIIEVYKKDGQPTPTNIFDNSYKVKFREKSSNSNKTGTAKKTISGVEYDQNWVQLWAGGPRFAIINVIINSNKKFATDTTKDPVTTHWGGDWRTPTIEEMAQLATKCTLSYNSGTSAVTITGVETGYTGNKISIDVDNNAPWTGFYWTSTLAGSKRFIIIFDKPSSSALQVDYWFNIYDPTIPCYLLAVLNE